MQVTKKTEAQASAAHDVRNATAVSGALVGATAGILGGIAGIGAAGVLGAVLGALGGLALERDLRRSTEAEGDEIAIEPACPDCVAARAGSADADAMCARHAKRHPHAILHYAYPPTFAMGSMLFRPAA